MSVYRRLLGYLRPYLWPHGAVAVTCMLAFSALESSVPFLVKYTIDQVFAQQRPDALEIGVGLVLGVTLLRGGLGFAGGYMTDWIGQRVVTDLRNQLTAHLQRLDLAFFNQQRAGQIVSRVTADATLVRSSVTDAVRSLFQDTTTLIGLTLAALWLDWVLAALAVLIFPIAALPIRALSVRIRQNSRRQQEATGRLNSLLHEIIQGSRVVKAFAQEEQEATRLRRQNELIFRLFLRASRLRALPVTEVLGGVAVAGILWYGGASVIAGTRTQGAFVGFLVTVVLLYEPFKKLVRTNYTIQQGLAGAERVFGLLDTRPTIVDRPGARVLSRITRGISFERVTFGYDPERPVLADIDLHIPVGQVVALVGMSGGGKSTLADLIPRFYDVTGGRVAIDGIDVREYTLASLRAQIAVVTQFTFLFNDTIRENIRYGKPDATQAELEAAARAANALGFIEALPQGWETMVGDLGVRLSGGQRQRIAIARALLKDAPILLLDEATSALDTESEGIVQEALERLMRNRTTLVVAHRLSTIRHADRIVVLVDGRVAEQGTHEELLANGREYRKLWKLQFGEGGGSQAPGPAAVAGRDAVRAGGQPG